MGEDRFVGHAQGVVSLQCVVAIVVVGWVFEDETALDRVSVNLTCHVDVVGLLQLHISVEEAHRGQRLAADDEQHTRVMPFLRVLKSYNGGRDCRHESVTEREKKIFTVVHKFVFLYVS